MQHNTEYRYTYSDFPELYDVLYQRYFASIPSFIEIVTAHVPLGARVLDMAAGTGEVTLPLLTAGYDVTSVDKSRGMLDQLRQKALVQQLGVRTIVADMASYRGEGKYDAITVRQAINYADSPAELRSTFRRFHGLLRPGGSVIFNAPNYHETREIFPTVMNHYSTEGGQQAVVVESNTLDGRRLRHRQDSLIWDGVGAPHHVRDENSFYMFTADEFRAAGERAGFRDVRLYGSLAVGLCSEDKTIYGVFVK